MKTLVVLIMVIVLLGCTNDDFSKRRYDQPLAYKCDIDPYNYECLNPPAVFKN